jgi:hypothetical protein
MDVGGRSLRQPVAGILPAEEAWLCRRDVGSTLLGAPSMMGYGIAYFMCQQSRQEDSSAKHDI